MFVLIMSDELQICSRLKFLSFFGRENDIIHLLYDYFRGLIDGSHLDMLYHMMT